jgi:hypothetical protein
LRYLRATVPPDEKNAKETRFENSDRQQKAVEMSVLFLFCAIYFPFILIIMIRTLYCQFQNDRILNAYRENIIKSGANYELPNRKTNFSERKSKLRSTEEQTFLSGRVNFTQRENKLF